MREVLYTHYLSDDELDSSALSEAWYDDETRQLFVRFQHGGSVAGYKDVPTYVWDHFSRAYSKGSYYATHIKTIYAGVDGDVYFKDRNAKPAATAVTVDPADANYRLVVKYEGELEFTVKADDVKAAIDQVEKVLAQSGRGKSSFVTVEAL